MGKSRGRPEAELWRTYQELGWLEAPPVELAIVLDELGYVADSTPFLATATWFAPLAGRLSQGAGTGVCDGTGQFVLDADRADEVALLTRDGVKVVRGPELDTERVATFDPGLHVAHVNAPDLAPGIPDLTLMGLAISTVGSCRRILDLAVAHVKQRVQFGVPIGSFQAVKHKAADMYVAIERARALAYFSALTIDAGYPVTLWARRPATLEPFAGTSAKMAGSAAEVAAASDLVCLYVVNDSDVEEVVTGEHGVLAGLREGGVIAVHSTVHPETCRRLADRAAAAAVRLVDAPVSGGGPAAAEGRLLVMAGGEPETVALCRPVFATYGDPVVYLGRLGSGQLTKLLNNLLFTAHLATAASTLALGQALGVDPARLADVLSHGSGSSYALDRIADAGGTVDPIAFFAAPLLQKDVRLIADLAGAAGTPPGAVLNAADAALALMNHPR